MIELPETADAIDKLRSQIAAILEQDTVAHNLHMAEIGGTPLRNGFRLGTSPRTAPLQAQLRAMLQAASPTSAKAPAAPTSGGADEAVGAAFSAAFAAQTSRLAAGLTSKVAQDKAHVDAVFGAAIESVTRPQAAVSVPAPSASPGINDVEAAVARILASDQPNVSTHPDAEVQAVVDRILASDQPDGTDTESAEAIAARILAA